MRLRDGGEERKGKEKTRGKNSSGEEREKKRILGNGEGRRGGMTNSEVYIVTDKCMQTQESRIGLKRI